MRPSLPSAARRAAFVLLAGAALAAAGCANCWDCPGTRHHPAPLPPVVVMPDCPPAPPPCPPSGDWGKGPWACCPTPAPNWGTIQPPPAVVNLPDVRFHTDYNQHVYWDRVRHVYVVINDSTEKPCHVEHHGQPCDCFELVK